MDEHERRDCPLSKVCYGCGRRGHHKSECPDPISRNKRWVGCERCGSREHTDKVGHVLFIQYHIIFHAYIYVELSHPMEDLHLPLRFGPT